MIRKFWLNYICMPGEEKKKAAVVQEVVPKVDERKKEEVYSFKIFS